MANSETISARIRKMRRERGLSQAQLARPELSDSYISLIESGNRAPTPAVLELLAAKLGCTVNYLINGVTDAQMQSLEGDLRQAWLALENGHALQARRRFAALLSNEAVTRFDALRHETEFGLARAAETCGDHTEAIPILARLLDAPLRSFTKERRIAIAIALSRCHRDVGDPTTAIEIAEQTLSEMGKQGWSDDLVELGSTLLSSYFDRGDMLRAEHFATELLTAADALGSPRAIVAANWNAAINFDIAGRGAEALLLAERAMTIQSKVGEPRNLARLRCEYAFIRLRNQPKDAAICRDLLLRAEREIRESSASKLDLANCLFHLAQAEIILGHIEPAEEYSRKGFDVLGDLSPDAQADAHLLLCREYLRLGRAHDATVEVKAAVELLDVLPATRLNSESWFAAAAMLEELGDQEESRRAYQRAMESGGV